MAYLSSKGYDFDIFISYSHIDNIKSLRQTNGWIEQFYSDLSVSLWQSIGTKDVKIWWDDRRLDGDILFDDAINKSLSKSAILLCLNSPAYLKSEYCNEELTIFHNNAQEDSVGLVVDDHSRILNVLLYNISHTNWPKEFSGRTGFHFHAPVKEDEDRGHPLNTDDSLYRTQLQKLTDALVNVMELIREMHARQHPKEFSIFFGDVAESLHKIRKQVITEVEKEGFKIICDVPPPFDDDKHEKAVKEKLEETALTVHLLNHNPGREIEDNELIWYPQKQVELVLEAAKPQLIWVPQDMNINIIEDEQYKNFIQRLEDGKGFTEKIEYIRGPKSELAQQIIELANEIKSYQSKQANNEKISVLLDTHFDDQKYAYELGETMIDNQIQPFINPQDNDPLKDINILEYRISQVSKLIFLYGKVALDWIIERINAAQQLILTKNYPQKDFFVFMLPPHKDANNLSLKQHIIKINVINNSDMQELNPDALRQFFNSLKGIA